MAGRDAGHARPLSRSTDARRSTSSASIPTTRWADDGPTRGVEAVVESGEVLSFPHLPFALDDAERRFLDPRWADGKAKNISLRWPARRAARRRRRAADLAALRAMVVRYAEQSEAFALRLFPHYRGHLRRGNTSFRPTDVAGRVRSWRKDDTRLHVDAFPSNPMHGTRLLRVFCNVNPHGAAAPLARRRAVRGARAALPARRSRGRCPGSAWLLAALGITKRRRTEYDHLMLQLHDRAKADAEFQRDEPAGARRLRARHDLGRASATRCCTPRWAAST